MTNDNMTKEERNDIITYLIEGNDIEDLVSMFIDRLTSSELTSLRQEVKTVFDQ